MLIIGIDPGISGSICFFENGKIIDVIGMPTMAEGKKNKKQVNGSQIYNVKKELEKEITNFISTEIEWVPLNSVKISKEKNEDLVNFFELLEDNDDVQNVYSNAEFVN